MQRSKGTTEEHVEKLMKRVGRPMMPLQFVLGDHYYFKGLNSFRTDHTQRQSNSFTRAGDLGLSKGHYQLADVYRQKGDMKKAKFYLEAAAMAGNEMARCNLG